MVKNGVLTLAEDGENFQEWRGQLLEMVDMVTDTNDYLSTQHIHDKGDRMIRTLIQHSVVPEISSQLKHSLSAKETFDQIVKMFHFPRRKTHMSLWIKLTTQRVDSINGILPHLNKIRA